MSNTEFSRRTFLASSAALAAGAVFGLPEHVDAQSQPGFAKAKIGDMDIITLHDGVAQRPIDEKFIPNAPFSDVQAALKNAGMEGNTLTIPFTTNYVDTGKNKILIDVGTGGQLAPTAGLMLQNMTAAGLSPDNIDTVIISHFHADHISGLKSKDGNFVFTKAQIYVPEKEWAYWTDEGEASRAAEGRKPNFSLVKRIFGDLGERVKTYKHGAEIVAGVSAIDAVGHTPGHTVLRVASGKDQVLVLSDLVNHPALFAKNPTWSPIFDMDAAAAIEVRKKIFDMAIADKIRVHGYHFPFPASGRVEKDGNGYAIRPV